jgi:peptidoglycan/xylan/chitin deacetylase (PgdA/CDA1 family)
MPDTSAPQSEANMSIPLQDRPFHSAFAVLLLALSIVVGTWACTNTNDVVVDPDREGLNPAYDCPTPKAQRTALEQDCDGVDNDCDGLTDSLAPVDDNRCSVAGAQGQCASGYFGCSAGTKLCIAPAPASEVYNGLDEDCNGVLDDVPAMAARPLRAKVLFPPYLAKEGFDDTVVRFALQQAGIPFDPPATQQEWPPTPQLLANYNLLILPGYLIQYAFGWEKADKAAQYQVLRDWVEAGGTLVAYRPLQSTSGGLKTDPAFADLFGFSASAKAEQIDTIAVEPSEATQWFDSGLERELRVMPRETTEPQDAFVYTVRADLPVSVLMRGYAAGQEVGPVALRRTLGKGAVYSFGHDLLGFPDQRCYINCFDPGRDIGMLLLAGLYRASVGGHDAVLHTVPGPEHAAILLSHDIDAPDAFLTGDHGGPGAKRMAEMEQAEGVPGTFFITSDYVTGYWRPELMAELSAANVGAIGGHSVQHMWWNGFATGDCESTQATYTPTKPTACGEISVNKAMVAPLVEGKYPFRSWRTPYLDQNPEQFKMLVQLGFLEDSSISGADLRTSLPIWLPQYPYHHDWLKHQPIIELPVTIEDGLGWVNPDGSYGRLELNPNTWQTFQRRWHETLLQQSRNGSWTTVLVHPSKGVSSGPENVQWKIGAVRWIIQEAKRLGLHFGTAPEAGDFWRARAHASLVTRWLGDGYEVQLGISESTAPVLTLRFGDKIASVTAVTATGVPVVAEVHGHIVVLRNAPANSQIQIAASVAK